MTVRRTEQNKNYLCLSSSFAYLGFRHGFTFQKYREMTTEEAKQDFAKNKKVMEAGIISIGEELKRTDLSQLDIDMFMEIRDSWRQILEGGHTLWQRLAG